MHARLRCLRITRATSAPRRHNGSRSSDRFTSLASLLSQAPGVLGHVHSLAALMHLVSSQHTLPKSGLTLETSYVVSPVNTSGPVRIPLRPSPDHLSIRFRAPAYRLGDDGDRAGLRSYLSPSFSACRYPYPRSLRDARSRCFSLSNGVRPFRKGSASSLLIAGLSHYPALPAINAGLILTGLQCSLNATAC